MSEPIVIEFDNKLSDHVAASRLFYKSTFWAKGDKIVAALLFLFGAIAIVLVGPQWWTLIWFPLAVCTWFNLLSPSRLQTRLIFHRNPKFLETYRLSFSDNGIHFKTDSIDSMIAWTHYTRILEDDEAILLVYGSRMYTVLPKRAFDDASQLSSFRQLARSHILQQNGV